jgi:hypothetical protein
MLSRKSERRHIAFARYALEPGQIFEGQLIDLVQSHSFPAVDQIGL